MGAAHHAEEAKDGAVEVLHFAAHVVPTERVGLVAPIVLRLATVHPLRLQPPQKVLCRVALCQGSSWFRCVWLVQAYSAAGWLV